MAHARLLRLATLAAVALVCVAPPPARAQAQTQRPVASAPPPASPAAIAAAAELLTVKGANVLFEPVVVGVIETVKNSFLPTNPGLGKELNEVSMKLRKDFEAKRAEIVREAAQAYAERFSEAELGELLAFYRSPVGKKMAAEEPGAIDESMKRAQVWADSFSGEVMNKFRDEMKKKGHTL